MIINPLLQMLIIGFIFAFIMRQQVENYYPYLFVGLLTWNFFSLTVTKATPSVVNERSLIKKSQFPRSVIPMSILVSNLVHYLISISLLVAYVIVTGTFALQRLHIFFAAIVILAVFTYGFVLITSALDVKYRDVAFFTQTMLTLWFYTTPIIYPLSFIPQHIQWMWSVNPLVAVLSLLHYVFLGFALPPTHVWLSASVIAVITCLVGILFFRRESADFDDWV